MTLMLERPSPVRPWWHIRPSERRPLALILGVGGPAGFLAGALLGIFLQTPGPPLPTTGRATQATTTTTVAPPGTLSNLPPARPRATGSDAAPPRAARVDVTRPAASSPAGRAPAPPTIRTTVTVTSTPPTTTPTPPTPADEEGAAPEGGDSLGATPS